MQYILIFVWIGFLALVARPLQVKRTVLVEGIEEDRYIWAFAFIAFLPVILMAGFRDRWFADTTLYVSSYLKMPLSISEIPDYMSEVSKDQGFSLLSCILKLFVKDDFRTYLVIIASIQGLILVSFFRKYSTEYMISVFLFVASTDYLSWMFNGIRQFMAVVIILLSSKYIFNKKYIPAIGIILIASTFHKSALLMIPVIFIVQGQAWNKKTILFIFATLIAIAFIGNFTTLMDSALADTQYSNVVMEYTSWKDNGTNPLRVAVYSIPAVISFIQRKKIVESKSAVINICANMSIVSAGLYVISMFTSGIFLGRLPIYCSLFGYILLPWELKNMVDEKTKIYIYVLMIVLYLAFYFFQLHFVWGTI